MAEKAQEKRASHAIARLAFLTNNLKLTEPRVQQGSEESLSKNEEVRSMKTSQAADLTLKVQADRCSAREGYSGYERRVGGKGT